MVASQETQAHGDESVPPPSHPSAPLPRAKRDIQVEVLRLVAIFGISVFHTFQPWFNEIAYNVPGAPGASALSMSALALFLLGLISLLGAMGNSIFYMISGFFLIPRMAADSVRPGYWKRQFLSTLRRVAVILVSVALYWGIGLVLHRLFGLTSASLTNWKWMLSGFEFVWLYLLFVILAPFAAWVQRRMETWPEIVALLFVTVMGFNVYIAFWNQGGLSRSINDWRKLMSALTYLVAFLLAGVIADEWEFVKGSGSFFLFSMIFVSVLVEFVSAIGLDRAVIGALSFKSTSVLSLLLATAALIFAFERRDAARAREEEREAAGLTVSQPRWYAPVRALASGILGLYITQSLFFEDWKRLCDPLLEGILHVPVSARGGKSPFSEGVLLLHGSIPSGSASPSSPGTVLLFVLAGIGLSLVFALVLLVIDLIVRQPILRALRLIR